MFVVWFEMIVESTLYLKIESQKCKTEIFTTSLCQVYGVVWLFISLSTGSTVVSGGLLKLKGFKCWIKYKTALFLL